MDDAALLAGLESQFAAGLKMVGDCVSRCPEDLWTSTESDPVAFWRVAYHVVWYTDLYLARSDADFRPWARHVDDHQHLGPLHWENNRMPRIGTPATARDLLEFIGHVRARVAPGLGVAPLEGPSGFGWLPFDRLTLHLYNLRHLQHHIGHLSHRLRIATGASIGWVGQA